MEEAVFQQYAKAWRQRQKDEEVKRTKRLLQARETAENLAEMLVQNYGAKEVWLFGSLIRSDSFHRNSDIDLAAAGLPAQQFFRILAQLNAATEFVVDLVDLDACPSWLATAIRKEGKLLRGKQVEPLFCEKELGGVHAGQN
ncbi:MAG: nucleotidyltransferase family protein [Moorellaceae bacterium]